MSFVLDPLPYAYDALAPYMSAETLEFHHDKHHAAYVNNANNLIKGTEWESLPIEQVITGSHGKNPARLQQRRPDLEPRGILEISETAWRRQGSGQGREGPDRGVRLGRKGP